MWNPDTGGDTKYPDMEEMCKIMFYIQLPNSDSIHRWTLAQRGPVLKRCGTRTLGRTPSVRPWKRFVKSCFIINCQLLTPFTSGPFLQKWASSTSVPSPMWNPDTGADTKYPDMEEMCKIMFYIQLPPSDSIHKWSLAQQEGRFQNGVEPGHWGGH